MDVSSHSRGRQLCFIVSAALLLLIVVGFQCYMFWDSRELVRIRNAFIAEVDEERAFDWGGSTPPSDFMAETLEPPLSFQAVVRQVLGKPDGSNGREFDHALLLAQHLSQSPDRGGAIKSSTVSAYETIMREGRGYCADYSQVFNGLAITAGIPVREWGMSFDRYSGAGHSFNEVYDSSLGKWVFIDTFYSLYVKSASTGMPMSVLEFRRSLLDGDGEKALLVEPISPGRFGFKTKADALKYYKKGSDQMFLYFGNNVFTYDQDPIVKTMAGISRALEQTAAIVVGVHPSIRLVRSNTNREAIDELLMQPVYFILLAGCSIILFVVLLVQIIVFRRKED